PVAAARPVLYAARHPGERPRHHLRRAGDEVREPRDSRHRAGPVRRRDRPGGRRDGGRPGLQPGQLPRAAEQPAAVEPAGPAAQNQPAVRPPAGDAGPEARALEVTKEVRMRPLATMLFAAGLAALGCSSPTAPPTPTAATAKSEGHGHSHTRDKMLAADVGKLHGWL